MIKLCNQQLKVFIAGGGSLQNKCWLHTQKYSGSAQNRGPAMPNFAIKLSIPYLLKRCGEVENSV
jgi:hypothetical protein